MVLSPREFDRSAGWDAAQVLDEAALGSRLLANERRTQNPAMRLLDGDAFNSGAIPELSQDCGLDVTDEKLRHGNTMISLIASVKSNRSTSRPKGSGCTFFPIERPTHQSTGRFSNGPLTARASKEERAMAATPAAPEDSIKSAPPV